MSEMIEVARSSVQTWECDQMGHMNVQFYVDKATQGLAALAVKLGLGRRFVASEGARLFARDHHVRFLREQRPGAPYFWRSGVLEVHDYSLRVYSEMVNTVSGDIAATVTAEVELLDEEKRSVLPLPAKAKTAAHGLMIELPAHGAPRGLTMDTPRAAPTLADADKMGMTSTFTGEVLDDMCDGQNFMTTRFYMGIVSDSIPNLLAKTRGEDRSSSIAGGNIGGAALEYRFIYRRMPQLGDVLTLRSGLKAVSEKTYVWAHWLFDYETGACVSTSEAVAISLDLVARKAVPIPEQMRLGLEKLVIPGLSV